MANIKISDMTRATSVGGSGLLPIVQGGESKSIEYKNMNKRSTTEQVVGVWIDNKPMYQISFLINLDISVATGENTIDLSSLNLETICEMGGVTKQALPNDTYYRNVIQAYSYNDSSVSEFSAIYVKNNTLYFRHRNIALSQVYITIRYTKTTDSAS